MLTAPAAVVDKYLDGRPYLFMPQKVMRRKNTLESLLLQQVLVSSGHEYGIVVTLPASGELDRKFEELVRETAREAEIPSVVVSKHVFGSQAPEFEEMYAGCAAAMTVSVMEGFGMTFS